MPPRRNMLTWSSLVMSVSVCILHLQDIIDASVQFKLLKEIFTFGLNLMKIVLMLKAQYVRFRIQNKQRNKGVVWWRRDWVWMGVVIFIPSADAIWRDSSRNHVHGWANVKINVVVWSRVRALKAVEAKRDRWTNAKILMSVTRLERSGAHVMLQSTASASSCCVYVG